MAKHKEIDHKELKGPDQFFETVGRTRQLYEDNRQKVFGLIGAIVLVFVAGVSWSSFRVSKADGTAAAFLRATDAIDLDSRATALAALQNVSDRGSGTYGLLAELYRAGLLAEEAKYDEALIAYRGVQNGSRIDFVRQVAVMGAGYCLEMTDQPAEAAAAYVQAAEMRGPYREQALRGQIRAAITATDEAIATAALESLLEEFPESPDAEELSQKLAAFKG